MSGGKWWQDLPKLSALDVALEAEGVAGSLADVARSIYAQESGSGKNTSTSTAGARGGMQILPGTFREVAGKGWDIDDPIDNARAGVRYIRKMSDKAGGDPALTAVGYYGGPGAIEKARRGEAVSDPRNPKAPTTLDYAAQVVGRMQKAAPKGQEQATSAKTDGEWWAAMPEVKSAAVGPGAEALPAPATDTEPQRQQAVPEPRGLGAKLARQVGLTARAGVTGLASLPALLSDAVTGPINAGLDRVRGEGNGFRFKKAGASLSDALTMAGLPQPESATERVVQDVAGAMAGAGGMVGAGKALAGAGSALAQGVGKTLAAGPGMQVASAATGSAASGAVRENGGGAGAQMAAGLAGALVPSVGPALAGAAVRGALRGGEAGRQSTAERVAMFRGAGTEPTVGQATGGRVARATESLFGKVPGGAGVIHEYATKQADDMARAVQTLSDDLAPGASAATAGEAIQRGVQAFKGGMKAVQSRLYRTLDQHIPADTRIGVDSTSRALAEMTDGVPGAQSLSKMFENSKVSGIEKALLQDLDDAAQAAGAGAGLPYEAVKKLRTMVGSELADGRLVNDVPRAQWARLYGALSDDLGVAARNAGPDAQAAWQWANTFTKTQLERLEQLSGIVGRDSPEKIFQAAIAGTAEGNTIAQRVISALPKQERREVAAAVLQRLGRATPGQQNAMGDAFSAETFLTNLAKMSPEARGTLFGRTDLEGVIDRLGQFAGVAEVRREGGRVFANPSGTAPAAAQIGLGSGIAGGVVAAAAGQPLPLLGALAVPVAANAGAKLMTSQGLVNMAATPAALAPGAQAAMVGAAARIDPDAQAAAQWWEEMPMAQDAEPRQDAVAPSPAPALPNPASALSADPPSAPALDALPPMDTSEDLSGNLERLADAQSVDEAIRAVHVPSPEQKAQARRVKEEEQARIDAQQRQQAAQAEQDARRQATVAAVQDAAQATEQAKAQAVMAIMGNKRLSMTRRRELAQSVMDGTTDPAAAYGATREGKEQARLQRVADENRRLAELRERARQRRLEAERDKLEAQRPQHLLSL